MSLLRRRERYEEEMKDVGTTVCWWGEQDAWLGKIEEKEQEEVSRREHKSRRRNKGMRVKKDRG